MPPATGHSADCRTAGRHPQIPSSRPPPVSTMAPPPRGSNRSAIPSPETDVGNARKFLYPYPPNIRQNRTMSRVLWALTAATLLFSRSSPADDKKKDPAQIGNRNVAGGPNFYSIEKEIALGRQLA